MYGTLAAFRAYATARGDETPASASDAMATAALTRASDYIQFSYVAMFVGGADSTKPEVEAATYEVAVLELATPGLFSKVYTPAQQKTLTGVGDLRWTPVTGAETGRGTGADFAPISTKVEAMLRKYMPGRYAFGMAAIGGSYG